MHILTVCGSLQARSSNRVLLDTAAATAPEGISISAFDGLRDLPPFDPDAAAGGIPAVERWRTALRESDAVLVACPEYGFSMPGVLKNAIDWVIGTGELERKVVGVTAAVSVAGRGRAGLESLSAPLRAVSARIVGGVPLVRGPRFDDDVAALVRAIARRVERSAGQGDAGAPSIEVWFDFASPYSYLATARAADVATRAGVDLEWRPFLLGPIFRKQGWTDSPFNLYPARGRYAWRDLERECERAALPFRRPSIFPRRSVRAARVAVACEREAWRVRFIDAVLRANFAEDRDIDSPDVLSDLLTAVGADAPEVLARAESAEEAPKLRSETERAEALGIFGAPTFVVGNEIFWGNDRLYQAVAWAVARA